MSLDDVMHQGFAQRLIQRAVSGDRVPHAYLFHGPDGVGKETLALGLAQLLLCGSPVERELEGQRGESVGLDRLRTGCGRCEDCRAVSARTHPDLHIVYRQLNREHPDPEVRRRKALDLGVDVLRYFVIEKVGLTPARGRAKVFVIREADRITIQAQNALLKTLEEPPGATVIILLVTALDRLLPTTLSRCQGIRFNALPTAFIRTRAAQLLPEAAPQKLDWCARIAEGSLGRALRYAEDGVFEVNNRVLEGLARLSCTDRQAVRVADPTKNLRSDEIAKAWAEQAKSMADRHRKKDPEVTETEANRRALKSLFQLAAVWYADVLRFASGNESTVANSHLSLQIRRAAGSIDPNRAIEAVNRIAQAERQLDLNANVQLCVETLLNDLADVVRSDRRP